MKWIQIAGTNGKGSTAIYISEILSNFGQCGLFTSPHINSPLERFKINGSEISQQVYDELLNKYIHSNDKHNSISSIFKTWTEMSKDWFITQNVDYAIMETGIGGRKDPTNTVNSAFQIITPIDFDHMEYLGNTIKKIAREKCGIIKWGSQVISHPQIPEVLKIIKQTCEQQNCCLSILDVSKIKIHSIDLNGIIFSFKQNDVSLNKIKLNSFSYVQVENACVAALCASSLGVNNDIISNALINTIIPGRIELKGNLILDAAHNPAAIKVLSYTLKKFYPNKHITVLTAIMKDKDVIAVSEQIKKFGNYIVCTCANKQRGLDAKEYKMLFENAQAYDNPDYAFEHAKEIAKIKNGIIVICGSFYILPYIYRLI